MKIKLSLIVDIPLTPFQEGEMANIAGKGRKTNPYLFDAQKRQEWFLGWQNKLVK